MQKGQALVWIIIGTLIIVAAGGVYYLGRQKNNSQPASPEIVQTSSFQPEDVVKTFYNTWLNCENEFNKYSLNMDKVPPEISQQREECIKKAINDYTIVQTEYPTGNSMWCAQDLPLKVEVDKATITNLTAKVISHHFFEQSGDNQIKVTLTLINNVWKISGTTCLNLTQSDETANWKTYQSTKYSYEFKYPSDWKLEELPSPTGGDFLQVTVSCIDCDSEYTVNYFSIAPVDYKSFEEYLSDRKKGNDLVSAIGEYQRVKIGTLDAIKAADPGICNPGTDTCQNSGIEYFVLNGTKRYLVSEGYKDLKYIKKLDQFPTPKPNILSTFKFQ